MKNGEFLLMDKGFSRGVGGEEQIVVMLHNSVNILNFLSCILK